MGLNPLAVAVYDRPNQDCKVVDRTDRPDQSIPEFLPQWDFGDRLLVGRASGRDSVLRSNCRLDYAECRLSPKMRGFRLRANRIALAAIGF